jgi:hypothetical protein
MSRRRRFLVGAACAVLALLAWSIPWRWLQSPEAIQASLCLITPLGSDLASVESALARQGLSGQRRGIGYVRQDPGAVDRAVGASSLRVVLGHYRLRHRTDVVAYWAFDQGGKLEDIWVSKTPAEP